MTARKHRAPRIRTRFVPGQPTELISPIDEEISRDLAKRVRIEWQTIHGQRVAVKMCPTMHAEGYLELSGRVTPHGGGW